MAILKYYNVEFSDFKVYGNPYISISKNAKVRLGKALVLNSGYSTNVIGRQQRCAIVVVDNAELTIGDNVGISCSAIFCALSINIGHNVRIGGNVCIYDTDFHSLNAKERNHIPERTENINKAAVIIENNVFIGAHSTILKGVTLGQNSVIGACSVVTKDIPPNQVWAGNPARFIKYLSDVG